MYYIITFVPFIRWCEKPWPPSDCSKNCKTYCQSSPAAKSLMQHYIPWKLGWQQHDTSPIPSKQKTMRIQEPPTSISSYRSVIFHANAQPLHVLIAALKTMISGRMPGRVRLCGSWTDSNMYCPCTEFSYTPNNLPTAICLGTWVLLKGNYKSSISFLLMSILLVSGSIHTVLVEKKWKKRVDIDFSQSFCQGCDPKQWTKQHALPKNSLLYNAPKNHGEVWKIRFFLASSRFLGGQNRGSRWETLHMLKPKEPGHSAQVRLTLLEW